MSFYVGLIGLCLLTLVVALGYARKQPSKRGFAAGFLFTLLTFFVAVDPSQHGRLLVMLTALTAYHMYLIFKK